MSFKYKSSAEGATNKQTRHAEARKTKTKGDLIFGKGAEKSMVFIGFVNGKKN
jgi:hypothetical protein